MRRFFASLALVLATAPAWAGNIIDFETTPGGGTPTDDASLTTAYSITGGTVQFYFDNNGNLTFDSGDQTPSFERVGSPSSGSSIEGFQSSRFSTPGNNVFDTAVNNGLGNWFLRQPDGLQVTNGVGTGGGGTLPTGAFIVDYNVTQRIDRLSGQIWDIDGNPNGRFEQWRVDALDNVGNILASVTSPQGVNFDPNNPDASLDSRAWTFAFAGLSGFTNPFDKLRIVYIGNKTDGVGLAFDNFDALGLNTPEPSTIASLAFPAALGLIAAARRRRASRPA